MLGQLSYAAMLHRLRVPALSICGEKDLQCPPLATEVTMALLLGFHLSHKVSHTISSTVATSASQDVQTARRRTGGRSRSRSRSPRRAVQAEAHVTAADVTSVAGLDRIAASDGSLLHLIEETRDRQTHIAAGLDWVVPTHLHHRETAMQAAAAVHEHLQRAAAAAALTRAPRRHRHTYSDSLPLHAVRVLPECGHFDLIFGKQNCFADVLSWLQQND